MSNTKVDSNTVIRRLENVLGIENQNELASLLRTPSTTLHSIELGTLIEKIITNIDKRISLDELIYGTSTYLPAQGKNKKRDRSKSIEKDIEALVEKSIERSKGRAFFRSILTLSNMTKDRNLLLLHLFLSQIHRNRIILSNDYPNNEFCKCLSKHPFKGIQFLTEWSIEYLDSASVAEIVLSCGEIKRYVGRELGI